MSPLAEGELDRRRQALLTAYDPERFADQAAEVTDLLRAHLASAAAGERAVLPDTAPDALYDRWPDPDTAARSSIEYLRQYIPGQ